MAFLDRIPDNVSFLSPVGFKFSCDIIPNVEFFCQSATLPGVSIDDIPISTPLNPHFVSGSTVNYEELRLEFIVDEDLANWQEIYNWIIGLGAPQRLDQYAERVEAKAVNGQGILSILSGSMNANKTIHYYNIFPTSLSGISFDARSTSLEYFNANVSFRYNYYEIRD